MKSPHVLQIECDVLGKIIGWEWRNGRKNTRGGKRVNTKKSYNKKKNRKESFSF
jgi:hypothetical protein